MQAFFKLIWTQIVNYFKAELADKVKAACLKGLKAFKDTVWKELKSEVEVAIKAAIYYVETYFNSEEAEIKEAMIVDKVVEMIKLPLIAKPFKGLIKKILKDKISALAKETIAEAKKKLRIAD